MKKQIARLIAPRRFEIAEEELPPLGEKDSRLNCLNTEKTVL
jgi:hypothetical protein